MGNRLFYGDNLDVLREHVADHSVDLIYLDPPFNSNASYNILFRSPTGTGADASIEAFDDAWSWGPAASAALMGHHRRRQPQAAHADAGDADGDRRQCDDGLSGDDGGAAAGAASRLEAERQPVSALRSYCEPLPQAGVGCGIRGRRIFATRLYGRGRVRTAAQDDGEPIHDTIFFYSKSQSYTWNRVYQQYETSYLDNFYRFEDERGRYRLVTLTGAGTRRGDSGEPWRDVNPTPSGRHWAVPAAALRGAFPDREMAHLTTQQKLDLLDEAGLIYWPPRGSVPQQKRYSDEAEGVPIQDMLTDIGPVPSQAQERLGYPHPKAPRPARTHHLPPRPMPAMSCLILSVVADGGGCGAEAGATVDRN